MHRFYVPPEISREESFVLPESEAHHATQVLRLRTGEEAEVLDGKGSRIRVRVEQVERRGLRVEVREVERQIFPAATSRMVCHPDSKVIRPAGALTMSFK